MGKAGYPCIGLEQDAFDENFTERSPDDLRYSLEARKISVVRDLID